MEDIFARASLCYLTNRFDEGFQLIDSFIMKSPNPVDLNWEEQEVFCLLSLNLIEKRYKSWINLNRLLTKTDDLKKRQGIQCYIELILNEMNFYSTKILLLIETYFLKSSFYLKIQGDIHFLLSQTSKFDKKLDHFLSSLHFYNQSLEICPKNSNEFFSIICNKALLFILITEEYDIARDFLRKTINESNKNQISNEKLQSLLNYCEEI